MINISASEMTSVGLIFLAEAFPTGRSLLRFIACACRATGDISHDDPASLLSPRRRGELARFRWAGREESEESRSRAFALLSLRSARAIPCYLPTFFLATAAEDLVGETGYTLQAMLAPLTS